MLENEPYERIAPDSASQAEMLSLLQHIYPPEKQRLGIIVFEFAQIEK